MLSKRWETMTFLFTGATISYMLRVNISVCAQKMRDELDWSEREKGLVLSAFFWGYALGQLPASFVADRIGSKATFGFAILAPSLLTLLVPIASKASFSAALCIRALIGLAAAGTFPSCYHFYPRWVPIMERTKLIAYVCSGMYTGEILGFALSGFLVGADMTLPGGAHIEGWEVVFYVFGLFGVVWFPFFVWRVYNTPDEHPSISTEELALIKTGNTFYTFDSDAEGLVVCADQKGGGGSGGGGGVKEFRADDYAEGTGGGDREEGDRTAHEPLLGEAVPAVRQMSVASDSNASLRQRHRSRSTSFVEALVEGLPPPTLEGFVDPSRDMPGQAYDHEEGKSGHHGRRRDIREIPWREMFSHPTSLTLMLNNWTFGWIGYMVLTELPTYLTDVLGYDLADAGLLSIVPYAANYISVMLFSWLFDYLQVEKGWSTRDVRQWAQRIGLLGASLSLIACGFMKQPGVAFSFMVIALSFFGAIMCGVSCAFIDVSPNFSNTIASVGNAIGAVAGFTGPIVVSILITTFDGRLGWQLAFFLTGLMSVVSLIFWKIFQTSDVIPSLNTPVKFD